MYGSAWAIWEDGRIAGIVAEKAGEFTTLPLRATGRPIEINARTGFSGSVQVDVLVDAPPGPPALRGRELTGDIGWRPVVWDQGTLADLAGKTIRLRFRLYDAKIFGYRGERLESVSAYARK